jgi:hypothetical protein
MNLQDVNALKEKLPHVRFETQNDNPVIKALYRGMWVGVENEYVLQSLINYNTFKEKNEDDDFARQYKNYYLIVLTNGKLYVSRSKSQCVGLKGNDGHAFVGLVGYDPDDESMSTVLVL